MSKKKIAIVGGGIVGLAIAYKIQKKICNSKVYLFEKENEIGLHQSGRNSGVLHCGLAYKPGSLKAKLAVSGINQMTEFCIKNDIPHDICGKVVIATNESESKTLNNIAVNGKRNGLNDLKFLSVKELKLREPHVVSKTSLLVPQEGIVDFKSVMNNLSLKIQEKGGEIFLNTKIISSKNDGNQIKLFSYKRDWNVDLVVNCAGLFSDRNYQNLTGQKRPLRIIPFRGEYMILKPEFKNIFNHLVYPVPDPLYPFLGIHFTRMINGDREFGPNAVFALKREGYKNTDISLVDTLDSLSHIGLLKFISNNFKFCISELGSSFFQNLFLKKAQQLIPEINSSMIYKGSAGVRAQAVGNGGELIMDFKIIREKNQIHVLNAPSPGATASFAIADYVIQEFIN